mgnify:CR=1 FL=1
MLSLYLKSILVYWIILIAVIKLAKANIKRENINLKDYIGKEASDDNGLSLLIISAVPIYRLGFFLVGLFLTVSTKDRLDKIFKKEDEENGKC